jgi:uncharacterized Zn finger protein (UPF0148 family)
MSFELFQRGGPLKAQKVGQDQYSLSVTIPKDADGRMARECPNSECSPGYFKVTPGTGLSGQKTAFCPYCRNEAEPSDFATKEQIQYAKDMVMREAKGEIHRALGDAFGIGPSGKKRLVDGFITLDVEMKSHSPDHVWQPFEEILRRDLVCPKCTLDHSVYGLATWCPDCGEDVFMTHVYEEIKVVEAIVGDVDRRQKELGNRVAARDLENALEDLVSVFEATLKIQIRRHLKTAGQNEQQIETVMKKIGSRLQSVTNAVVIVPENCGGVLLIASNPALEAQLDRVFQKRHPITHNLGVVDRKYLDRAPSGEAEGREVRVDKHEIIETSKITFEVLSALHKRLFPTAAPS